MLPIVFGVETSTAYASMAMSWVADAVVKRKSRDHIMNDGWDASWEMIAIVVAPKKKRQAVIHCWRLP
jgi:hypothetical protein